MATFLPTAVVCFIACHGGPADHFATFAEDLLEKGYQVEIYATGPALKKLQDRHLEIVKPFSLENTSEEAVAIEVAQRCGRASVIITDVGHAFDVTLQKTLASHLPKALRLAYYDNPEPYVPGGYSAVAAKVMMAAQGVLFANGNLSQTPIYQAPSEVVRLAPEKRRGIGYYPVSQADKIAKRRMVDRPQIRMQLFTQHSLVDRGQSILVYAGGNHEEYFSKALPAFLQFIEEASHTQDLSNMVVLLQQHPGAKETNLDVNLIQQWVGEHREAGGPQMLISGLGSDEAQVVADAMLYYQTSMGPQFILAGIPTMQVGHNTYEDILVTNRLCPSITDSAGLVHALTHLYREGFNNWEMPRRRPTFESGFAGTEAAQPERLSDAGGSQKECLSDAGRTNFRITSGIQERVGEESGRETMEQGLGITPHWAKQLEDAIGHFLDCHSMDWLGTKRLAL